MSQHWKCLYHAPAKTKNNRLEAEGFQLLKKTSPTWKSHHLWEELQMCSFLELFFFADSKHPPKKRPLFVKISWQGCANSLPKNPVNSIEGNTMGHNPSKVRESSCIWPHRGGLCHYISWFGPPPPPSTRTQHQDIYITSLARGTGFQWHQRIWQSDPTSVSFAAWWTRGEFYKGHLAENHQGSFIWHQPREIHRNYDTFALFPPHKYGYFEGSLIIRIDTHLPCMVFPCSLGFRKNVDLGIQVIFLG